MQKSKAWKKMFTCLSELFLKSGIAPFFHKQDFFGGVCVYMLGQVQWDKFAQFEDLVANGSVRG